AMPVMESRTVIDESVIDAGSIDGAKEARMPVDSETLLVSEPALNGTEALLAVTVTAVTRGGCGVSVRSTFTTASASGAAAWVYGAPSPVEAWRGVSVNGAEGLASTGML